MMMCHSSFYEHTDTDGNAMYHYSTTWDPSTVAVDACHDVSPTYFFVATLDAASARPPVVAAMTALAHGAPHYALWFDVSRLLVVESLADQEHITVTMTSPSHLTLPRSLATVVNLTWIVPTWSTYLTVVQLPQVASELAWVCMGYPLAFACLACISYIFVILRTHHTCIYIYIWAHI